MTCRNRSEFRRQAILSPWCWVPVSSCFAHRTAHRIALQQYHAAEGRDTMRITSEQFENTVGGIYFRARRCVANKAAIGNARHHIAGDSIIQRTGASCVHPARRG